MHLLLYALQLRAVSEDTGLEVMVLGMGFVKCGAQYSPLEQQHESGMYVMGVKTTAPDHRLVLASSSTGGALRSAMDTPCSIAGLTAAQIPARVLRMCAAKQHILALAQLVSPPHWCHASRHATWLLMYVCSAAEELLLFV